MNPEENLEGRSACREVRRCAPPRWAPREGRGRRRRLLGAAFGPGPMTAADAVPSTDAEMWPVLSGRGRAVNPHRWFEGREVQGRS